MQMAALSTCRYLTLTFIWPIQTSARHYEQSEAISKTSAQLKRLPRRLGKMTDFDSLAQGLDLLQC